MSALLIKTLKSTTFRWALIFIGAFGIAIVALFAYVYVSTASFVRNQAERAITLELELLQSDFDRSGRQGVVNSIERRIHDPYFADNIYLLVDASLSPIAGNLRSWPPSLNGNSGWEDLPISQQSGEPSGPKSVRGRFEALPDGTRLLVGTNIAAIKTLDYSVRIALGLSIALILAIGVAVGISVTRRTVGRIEAINATSRAIIQSGLGGRIPLRGSRDEWDELATNLNSMLGRIESLMSEVKQFTDNVAHDLRTPLARIRGRLEKAVEQQLVSESDRTLITDTLIELDSVLSMFSSLLRISQIEASDRTAAFRVIDLVSIAREVVELYDAAAEAKGTNLHAVANESVLINGDRDLLFDAIANLVDNAIKHSRPMGRVTVDVAANADEARVTIADDGPGIPPEEREHVFKRFYRLEKSRGTAGHGLGLSLVAAIMRLHGGDVVIADGTLGFELQLLFPLSFPAALVQKGVRSELKTSRW